MFHRFCPLTEAATQQQREFEELSVSNIFTKVSFEDCFSFNFISAEQFYFQISDESLTISQRGLTKGEEVDSHREWRFQFSA
jgi:hypothetical protein